MELPRRPLLPLTLTTTVPLLPITLMMTTLPRPPRLLWPPTTVLPKVRTLPSLTLFCPPKCPLWELTKPKNLVKPVASVAVEAVQAVPAVAEETTGGTTDEEAAGKVADKAVASAVKLQFSLSLPPFYSIERPLI